MIIFSIILMGCLLGLALDKPIQAQRPPNTPKKPKKSVDVDAIREELTFLEIRCQNLIDLLNCIDLIYGKSHDAKKQAQLIRKRMTIDQQYHNAMQKRYKLEKLLRDYDEYS